MNNCLLSRQCRLGGCSLHHHRGRFGSPAARQTAPARRRMTTNQHKKPLPGRHGEAKEERGGGARRDACNPRTVAGYVSRSGPRATHPNTVHIAVVVRHGVVVRRTLDVVLVAEAVVGASRRSTKLLLLSTTAKQENEGAQQTQTQVVQSEADSVVTQAVQHVRRRRPPGSMPSRRRADQRAGRPRAGQTRPAVAAPPSGSAQSWRQ